MAFIPTPDGSCRVRVTFQMGLADSVNVFHWAKNTTTPWTLAELDAVANKFAGAYNFETSNGPLSELSSLVTLTGVEAIDTTDEGAPAVSTSWSIAGGQASSPPCPPAVAVGITFQTQRRGKSYRGRCYVMGVPEGSVNESGQLSGTPKAAWQSKWGVWLGQINSATGISGALQVASYYAGGAPRAQAVMTPVTNLRVNENMRTQRRRQYF